MPAVSVESELDATCEWTCAALTGPFAGLTGALQEAVMCTFASAAPELNQPGLRPERAAEPAIAVVHDVHGL